MAAAAEVDYSVSRLVSATSTSLLTSSSGELCRDKRNCAADDGDSAASAVVDLWCQRCGDDVVGVRGTLLMPFP